MAHGPATPSYILRGHVSPVHALCFFPSNSFLLSGDSDGWIVLWGVASKRPAAVWKAHDSGIMCIRIWGSDQLVTHGRDHKLRVWHLQTDSLDNMSTKLPVDGVSADEAYQPWLLHSMDVGALNFCAFVMCEQQLNDDLDENAGPKPQLIAAPNGLDSGGVDIFQVPSEHRVSQLHSDESINTGMVMALALFHHQQTGRLCLISGYEDGQVMMHYHSNGNLADNQCSWMRFGISKPHTQPVLSIGLGPDKDAFITTSADATIARFRISQSLSQSTAPMEPEKTVNTKHAGQQGLHIRSDGRVFATAGWDARVRVYSMKTMKEVAVLKWHNDGCYATAFANIELPRAKEPSDAVEGAIEALSKTALDIIKEERETKAQRTHWLAAGGKDGKISLWDIY